MFEQLSNTMGPKWMLLLILATLILAVLAILIWLLRMTQMPLKSYTGQLSPLSSEQIETRNRLSQHEKYLSETIGERNMIRGGSLQAAIDYIRSNLQQAGYSVTEQTYDVQGYPVSNLEARRAGSAGGSETVVVGAHYDSVPRSPGANDNASGVAAVLELARLFQSFTPRKTVRFVLFVNEEPPFFQSEIMGSLVYARQLRRDQTAVTAMISLETIGFYSDAPGSQKYPPLLGLFYPNRGNFIAFVGNPVSRELVRRAIGRFRETTRFPSEGIAAPSAWPGVGWSDQWAFWREQYPAIMITDTALFRYPYYHTPFDTVDHVDFERMTRVVDGLRRVLEFLSSEQ